MMSKIEMISKMSSVLSSKEKNLFPILDGHDAKGSSYKQNQLQKVGCRSLSSQMVKSTQHNKSLYQSWHSKTFKTKMKDHKSKEVST